MTAQARPQTSDTALADLHQHVETGLLLMSGNADERQRLLERFAEQVRPVTSPIDVILARRSVVRLVDPGPTASELRMVLEAAMTVPDHGRLQPWRFAVVEGNARQRFAAALRQAAVEHQPGIAEARLAKIHGKAYAAPLSIAVVFSPQADKGVPIWEQQASACCTGYAMGLAAHALGLGAVWKSVPFLEAAALRAYFQLDATEQLLGWVHIGHVAGLQEATGPLPRRRADVVSVMQA